MGTIKKVLWIISILCFSGTVFTTCADAIQIPLDTTFNNVTVYSDKSSSKDVATIMGYDGGIENGSYKGAAMALTSVDASAVFYGSEIAGVKVNWDTELTFSSANPVNLYLDVNTWAQTSGFIIALGSIYHYLAFDIEIWTPFTDIFGFTWYFPRYSKTIKFDDSADLHEEYLLGQLTDESIYVKAKLEIASALSFGGPGVASASAFGYLDYALRIDDPTIPTPSAVPEPATITLFGIGMVGLAVIGRRKRNTHL